MSVEFAQVVVPSSVEDAFLHAVIELHVEASRFRLDGVVGPAELVHRVGLRGRHRLDAHVVYVGGETDVHSLICDAALAHELVGVERAAPVYLKRVRQRAVVGVVEKIGPA